MTTVEAYQRIAPFYDSAPNPLRALERRTLTPLLPDLQGRTVADIGAGTGRWLHRLRAARRIAIDLSPAMLASAPAPRIVADAHSLPLRDEAADAVLCTFTLGYVPVCFPELVRILRPGGTLIVTDVHPDAIARGWTRTFRAGDETVAPPHFAYSIESLSHPSLARQHLLEPHIGEPERSLFDSKPHLYDAARAHPAIYIAVWTKLGCPKPCW